MQNIITIESSNINLRMLTNTNAQLSMVDACDALVLLLSWLQVLESHWKEIRDEGLANLNEKGLFEVEAEDLRDTGDWKQFTLYTQGRLNLLEKL